MRKRLGILLLIFCLFLIFPIQQSKGESLGDVLGPPLALIILSIWGLTPESWKGDCDMYFHPGDLYYEKNFNELYTVISMLKKCKIECGRKNKIIYAYRKCEKPCKEKAAKELSTTLSIATCKDEGIYGYYSDGSYYNSTVKNMITYDFFINKHELKDKYEKNEWQKTRDACMQKVSENKEYMKKQSKIKSSDEFQFPDTNEYRKNFPSSPNPKATRFYNECLKERGF